MGPDEDHGAEPADQAPPSEDLEHWLRDLRTEAVEDPFGWAGAAAAETPAPARTDQATGGGRHRAAD